ncbi:c-type cytochrome [Massilia sp. 9096]|uniref:c-type cytochrome n=1 Tax=Massilia sp. 9096 TaxID=1500894 RepID=UPI0009E081F7|nr:c-type cytochrome [Massilia sp. 9096]
MRGPIPVLAACSLAICLLAGLAPRAAPSQSISSKPDLRRVPDSMAQRLAPCLSCHGNGTAERRYYPRIAGKPAGYLYNQLQNFRAGRRQYPLMTWMVTPLSDDYLHEIADWFAAQHLPSPVLERAGLPTGELARGRQLVTRGDPALRVPACIACHGERLSGALPAVPGLVGLPRDYINAQFGAWRNGTRRAQAPDCMAQIATRLSLSDVSAISAWLASEPQPADPTPAPTVGRPLPLACGSVAEGA